MCVESPESAAEEEVGDPNAGLRRGARPSAGRYLLAETATVKSAGYAVPPPIEARMIRSASSRVQPIRALAASHAFSASFQSSISISVGK